MPGNPFTDPNWAPDLADTIDRYVGKVRDNVTAKAATAVRALVFGIIIGITAIALLIVGIILVTKLVQHFLAFPLDPDTAVWVSYMALGGILVLGGAFLMRKRFAGGGE